MRIKKLIAFSALLISIASLDACAGRITRLIDQINRHVERVHENNSKACARGCILFEGDSNLELTYVQDYFTEPACNLAVRGSATQDLLERKEAVAKIQPAIIIMLVGGNDLIKLKPREQIEANYVKLITYYRSLTEKLYCISNMPVSNHPQLYVKNEDIVQINVFLEKACKKYGVTYVNAHPLIAKNGILNPDYALDPVHLNKAGQDVLMNFLKNQIVR